MKAKYLSHFVTLLFGLIGVGMLVGAYLTFAHNRDFSARATRAEGVVKDLLLRHSGSSGNRSSSYRPRVAFTTLEGKPVEFVGSVGSNPPAYDPGERVTVLYLPENPYRATIEGFSQQWLLVVILTGMGSVFLAIGGVPLAIGLRRRRLEASLMREGRTIQARYNGVERSSVSRNGRRAFYIVAHWQDPLTGKLHVLRSRNIWFDPTDYVSRDLIDVRMDPSNPKRYLMDLSFLPELAD